MHLDTCGVQLLNSGANIHCITTKTVKLGNDQHITFFHTLQKLLEARAFRCLSGPADCLSYHAVWLHLEACTFHLKHLVVSGLISGGDTGVNEGA